MPDESCPSRPRYVLRLETIPFNQWRAIAQRNLGRTPTKQLY